MRWERSVRTLPWRGRPTVVAPLVAVAVACSSGPGRPGVVDAAAPDALVLADAAAPDADPADAGFVDPTDAGFIDIGPPPSFAFTGTFGILDDAAPLYAREVDGALMLVVGFFPYVYFGTIDPDGRVDATGTVLEDAGCPEARIAGAFGRQTAAFELLHTTCNAMGAPVSATLLGGFAADFRREVGGVYTLTAQVNDLTGCAPPVVRTVRYAVNQLPDGQMQVFTFDDLLDAPAAYFGRLQPNGVTANLEQRVEAAGTAGVAMRVVFGRANANEPMGLTGFRDAYDPVRRCPFRVELTGTRVDAP